MTKNRGAERPPFLGGFMARVLSKNEKSVLIKHKLYCPDDDRLSERFFVYEICFVKGVIWVRLLTEKDHPDCKPYGITSLRKAKAVHLLNSI